MNKRPILRKVHLTEPSFPEGNLSTLVSVHVTFHEGGDEAFLCKECVSDKCVHCEKVFDDLCAEGVLHA